MTRHWTAWIGQQLPLIVQNNVTTSPARRLGAFRHANGKVSVARLPARPFNRVNGKAALCDVQKCLFFYFCIFWTKNNILACTFVNYEFLP